MAAQVATSMSRSLAITVTRVGASREKPLDLVACCLLQWVAMKALAAASILLMLGADAETAEACSPPQCWPGSFTPAQAASVPANLPAFHWQPTLSFDGKVSDPSKVSLKTAAGDEIPITGTPIPNGDWVFAIDQALVAGTTYVLTDLNLCAGDQLGPTATFTADVAAPLPTDLGTLVASDHRIAAFEVGTSSGSCSASIDGDQVLIDLVASATAEPWRDVLMVETLVDGGPWRPQTSINFSQPPGTSWRGRGADRVYTTCFANDPSAFTGTTEGAHEVTMRATLPGGTTAWTASVPIELSCNPFPPDECEGALLPHGGCEDDHGGGCNAGGATGLLGLAFVGLLLGRRRIAK